MGTRINVDSPTYCENLVARNSKNPKCLWSSISGILCKPSRPLETLSFTASDFLDMLTSKTDRLCATTMDVAPLQLSTTTLTFVDFRPILESDLRSVLTAVNLKSSELDPPAVFHYCRTVAMLLSFCFKCL